MVDDSPPTSDTASEYTASRTPIRTLGADKNMSASPALTTYVNVYVPLPASVNVDDTFLPWITQHCGRYGTKPDSDHIARTVTFMTSPNRSVPDDGDTVTDAMDGTSRTTITAAPDELHPTLTFRYIDAVSGVCTCPLA